MAQDESWDTLPRVTPVRRTRQPTSAFSNPIRCTACARGWLSLGVVITPSACAVRYVRFYIYLLVDIRAVGYWTRRLGARWQRDESGDRMLPPACVRKGTTRRLHPGGQDREEEEVVEEEVVEGRREPGSDRPALISFGTHIWIHPQLGYMKAAFLHAFISLHPRSLAHSISDSAPLTTYIYGITYRPRASGVMRKTLKWAGVRQVTGSFRALPCCVGMFLLTANNRISGGTPALRMDLQDGEDGWDRNFGGTGCSWHDE